jgi:CRP-like cAMP-binding protein
VANSSSKGQRNPASLVGKIGLLNDLSPEVLEKVTGFLQFREAEKGDNILQKGSPGDHLVFLLSGRLQVLDVSEDGREIGLTFLNVGDYFGELSVLDGLPRSANVVASENSTYALLPRTHALNLIYNQPLVAERVLKKMAADVRKASNYRAILSIPNAFQRVYAVLHYLARTSPSGLVTIEHMPTQHEISIMVNTSRETVSRAISVITDRKWVEKDMKRLIVRDPEALRLAGLNEPSTN